MIRYIYSTFFNTRQQLKIKQQYYKIDSLITKTFLSYDSNRLNKALKQLGIRRGDTLLVHSSYNYLNGFRGTPQGIIDCLIDAIGTDGNLLMVSLPYTSSSYAYLKNQPYFDVRKTPSKMGIISEIFRRRQGVLRSLHPTHPVLVLGKKAPWIVEDHQCCLFPCGENTPFHKLRLLSGKILFFDAPFSSFTFIHYIEDLIKDDLPFDLYRKRPMAARLLDYEGNQITVKIFVFSDVTLRTRDPRVLEKCLLKRNMLKRKRVGNTTLMVIKAEDAIQCTKQMLANNIYFYAMARPR